MARHCRHRCIANKILVLAVLALYAGPVVAAVAEHNSALCGPADVRAAESYGELPLSFIENRGQVDLREVVHKRAARVGLFYEDRSHI